MLTREELQRLSVEAARFRAAIEDCAGHLCSVGLLNFPHGSCGDAALLLGHYLIETGFGPFDYVCGYLPDNHPLFEGRAPSERDWSHAWLAKSALVVDITADQFPEVESKTVVQYDSTWHCALRRKRKHGRADFVHYDARTAHMLGADYAKVLRHLRKDEEVSSSLR
jgi:hypothetical protein